MSAEVLSFVYVKGEERWGENTTLRGSSSQMTMEETTVGNLERHLVTLALIQVSTNEFVGKIQFCKAVFMVQLNYFTTERDCYICFC